MSMSARHFMKYKQRRERQSIRTRSRVNDNLFSMKMHSRQCFTSKKLTKKMYETTTTTTITNSTVNRIHCIECNIAEESEWKEWEGRIQRKHVVSFSLRLSVCQRKTRGEHWKYTETVCRVFIALRRSMHALISILNWVSRTIRNYVVWLHFISFHLIDGIRCPVHHSTKFRERQQPAIARHTNFKCNAKHAPANRGHMAFNKRLHSSLFAMNLLSCGEVCIDCQKREEQTLRSIEYIEILPKFKPFKLRIHINRRPSSLPPKWERRSRTEFITFRTQNFMQTIKVKFIYFNRPSVAVRSTFHLQFERWISIALATFVTNDEKIGR